VLRVERHERQLQAILDTRGASRVDVIDPPARLVGAGTQ
jgi:hypothetical protein